jgi:hypothetical protein
MAILESSCYSFFREELQDFSYVYQFSSANGLGYKVYFNASAYDQWLEEYPYLFTNGYAFGFLCMCFNKADRRRSDQRVAITICRIIEHFQAFKGPDCVLLYHCDASDNRQAFRFRLFHKWYNCFSTGGSLIKNDLEVVISSTNLEAPVTYYLGYIAHADNPGINILHNEFEDIALNFVGVTNLIK